MQKNILKITYTTLVVVMVIITTVVKASAVDSITMSVDTVNAQAGEIITIPVRVSNNCGFVSASFHITYDETVMTLRDVVDMGVIPGQMHNTKYTSPYLLTWVNDSANTNYTSNGVLVSLIFILSDTITAGEYPITITAVEDGIISADGTQPSCTFVDGAIIIEEEECSHSWGTWKRANNSNHKRVCTLCDEVEYERHEWDDGEVTEEPTEDSTGLKVYTCDICEGTKTSIIPALEPDEYEISGIITSYGDTSEKVTVKVIDSNDEVVDSLTTTSSSYSLEMPAGTYTLEVSKKNHVTREYAVTAVDGKITQDVEIWLKGDVNGDGKIKAGDYKKVKNHYDEVELLKGYALQCADVTGDDKIKAGDYKKIKNHYDEVEALW